MSMGNTGAGFGATAEYMTSALPWVSGSIVTSTSAPMRVNFPKVTKYIKVRADQANVRVGFTANGINGTNYFLVTSGTVETFDVRVKEVYLRAHAGTGLVDVFAGLTLIPERQMSLLTGSAALTGSIAGAGWSGVG
jgi:hypothetical protein